jgi:hypothetical protein
VAGCIFDAPDYGVVVDSDPGTGAAINNVRISNNRFTINWGSAVSLAGAISGGVVSGNVIRLLGDLPDLALDTGVGIGVKIWDGADISNSNADISITGNAFIGPSSRTDIQGVSIANFSKRVVINGNTFFQMTKALLNNFAGSGVLGISFTSNVCYSCDYGVLADDSTDTESVITGNQFISCGYGVKSTLRDGIISNNKFRDTTNNAVWLVSPSEHGLISGNSIKNTGKEAIYQPTDGASNDSVTIHGNSIFNSCSSADNTYDVILLNAQAAIVSGNTIVNESTTVKPIYIIGSAAGANYRLISGNWMYGARSGYREISGANDVYADNIERGGIG